MFSVENVIRETQTQSIQLELRQKVDSLLSDPITRKDADRVVDLCRQMIEAVEGTICPDNKRSGFKDKITEHANLRNIFRTFGGESPNETFSLPWYYKVLNPWSTISNALTGVASNFSIGQRNLYKDLTHGRADVPGWFYSWAPKAWQPFIRDRCNNFFRPIIGFSDFLPLRAIRAFRNPANAQLEHLTRLQEFSLDVFHQKRAVLQREIHKILLRNKPEFSEAICYKLFDEGLTAPNYACDTLSPEDEKFFSGYLSAKGLPTIYTNTENFKEAVINFQKLQACKKLAGNLTVLFHQGHNRLGFLGANLVDGLAYPETTKAHREAMTTFVSDPISREDKIRKLQTKGWGSQAPLALMIRQIIGHGFHTQNIGKALIDSAPIFEVDKDNTSAFELYFNTPDDISFAGTDRILEKMGNSNEAAEWSFMPGSGHLDTLKYEKPLVRRMHGGELSLRFKQQSATDFFINTIADAFTAIDASEARLANGKNDTRAEVDYLAAHYRRLQLASDAFFQHCRAFMHVNGGVLPRDVCNSTRLADGSKVYDLINQVTARIRPYYENHHRFVDIKPENLDKLDPTYNDNTTGKPFAKKIVNIITGKIEYKWADNTAQSRFEQAERAYISNINKRLTDVAGSHKRIAGMIHSMRAQYEAATQAAKNIIAKLPENHSSDCYNHIKVTSPTKESRYKDEQVVGSVPEDRGYRAVVDGGGTIEEHDSDPLLGFLAERQASLAAAR